MEPTAMDLTTLQFLGRRGLDWLVGYGPRLPAAAIIFLVGRWAASWLTKGMARLMRGRRVESALADFISRLGYYGLLLATTVVAIAQLGIDVRALLTVLGAASFTAGLALKDSLSNFAAGILLILLRLLRSGDEIIIGTAAGTVTTIRLFHTELFASDGRWIIVPNIQLVTGVITKTEAGAPRRVELAVTLPHGVDLGLARKALFSLVAADSRTLVEPAPQVVVIELTDKAVQFQIYCWAYPEDVDFLRGELLLRLPAVIAAMGITLAQASSSSLE
ncbi:membrane hypothetical protein [Desulfovibrionales bacterium]